MVLAQNGRMLSEKCSGLFLQTKISRSLELKFEAIQAQSTYFLLLFNCSYARTSKNYRSNLSHSKIIRLQSQNASDDQMRMVRWLQQGYVGTVSSLAGALTGYIRPVLNFNRNMTNNILSASHTVPKNS